MEVSSTYATLKTIVSDRAVAVYGRQDGAGRRKPQVVVHVEQL